MRKPIRVKSPCVADRYSGPKERIIEFRGTNAGGLISVREMDDGTLVVEVYRCDGDVVVVQAGGKHIAVIGCPQVERDEHDCPIE